MGRGRKVDSKELQDQIIWYYSNCFPPIDINSLATVAVCILKDNSYEVDRFYWCDERYIFNAVVLALKATKSNSRVAIVHPDGVVGTRIIYPTEDDVRKSNIYGYCDDGFVYRFEQNNGYFIYGEGNRV